MDWKAKFIPQAWVNDNAVTIDAYDVDTWDIAEKDALAAIETARGGGDWDYLRDTPDAPHWVREYPGPFQVEIVAPDGDVLTENVPEWTP
jgi:hypothetical protein